MARTSLAQAVRSPVKANNARLATGESDAERRVRGVLEGGSSHDCHNSDARDPMPIHQIGSRGNRGDHECNAGADQSQWKPSVSASDCGVCGASRWLVRLVASEVKIARPNAAPSSNDAVISDGVSPVLSSSEQHLGGPAGPCPLDGHRGATSGRTEVGEREPLTRPAAVRYVYTYRSVRSKEPS
jgi:hypothetical protein